MSLRLIDTLMTAANEVASLSSSRQPVTIDGQSLTISQLVSIARFGSTPKLGIDQSPELQARIEASVACLAQKIAEGEAM